MRSEIMIMNRIINILMLAIVAWLVPCNTVAAGPTVVDAELDSTVLLMGKQTALHIEISQDKDAIGAFVNENADTLTRFVEIIHRLNADTADIGNNRVQIKCDWILQSFDSGVYVLPPLQYVIGRDTFESEQLSLKVLPVNVDTLSNVHDYKNTEGVPFHLFDFLPDFIVDYWWVYLLIAAIVIVGLLVYFKWIKKGRIPLIPQKKIVPPYEEAMQRLEELKGRKLWQSGQEKEYYTVLTDILRNYIDRRFSINAMEMTTSQIVSILRKNEETKAVNEQLGKILEIADFVKFAKVKPLPDDNEVAYQRAVTFVEETKPVEAPVEETENDDKSKNAAEEPPVEQKGGKK